MYLPRCPEDLYTFAPRVVARSGVSMNMECVFHDRISSANFIVKSEPTCTTDPINIDEGGLRKNLAPIIA